MNRPIALSALAFLGAAVTVLAAAVRPDPPPLALGSPAGLALAPDGRVIVADRRLHRVFALDLEAGELAAIAGTGTAGFSGDGGPALEAELQNPEWVDFTPGGDLLIADRGNSRIRRVDAGTGRITTIAGTGEARAAGDGGPAIDASLTYPFGVTVDDAGHVYVFDTEAHSIRRIDAQTGIIRTVAGTGESGFSVESGPGTEVALARPHNGVMTRDGHMVFGDSFNQRIRSLDPETGRVETIAGAGREGVSPPGTPAVEAEFTYFGGLAQEPDGSLVYTGLEGRIMRIRATDGRLEHVAGIGEGGFAGDGGPATRAAIQGPYGIVRLPDGDFVFSDAGNSRIRRIDDATGTIRTVAGP